MAQKPEKESNNTPRTTLPTTNILNDQIVSYYEILGIPEDATQSQIKAAHRRLALQYHPDKQLSVSSNSQLISAPNNTTTSNIKNNTTAASISQFTQIQTAYECLGNIETRRVYDSKLLSIREKRQGIYDKAISVKLSDMHCEICDIIDDEEEDDVGVDDYCHDPQHNKGNDHINPETSLPTRTGSSTQKLYTYPCRCGDCFEILEEEINFVNIDSGTITETYRVDIKAKHNNQEGIMPKIWECQSCSLAIKLVLE